MADYSLPHPLTIDGEQLDLERVTSINIQVEAPIDVSTYGSFMKGTQSFIPGPVVLEISYGDRSVERMVIREYERDGDALHIYRNTDSPATTSARAQARKAAEEARIDREARGIFDLATDEQRFVKLAGGQHPTSWRSVHMHYGTPHVYEHPSLEDARDDMRAISEAGTGAPLGIIAPKGM